MAATLKQIGGEYADLTERVHRAQVRTETAGDQISYETDKDEFITGLKTDLEYAGHAEKFTTWHDDTTKSRLEALKTEEARKEQTLWYKKQRNYVGIAVAARANVLIGKSDAAALTGLLTVAEKTGDFTDAENHAVGMVADGNLLLEVWENMLSDARDNAEKWRHQQILKATYANALAVLEEGGLDAVEQWLAEPENTKEHTGPEKYRLAQQMRYEDNYAVIRADRESAVETKETVLGLAGTYLSGGLVKLVDVNTLEHPDLKKRWIKIQAKQKPVLDDKVDWKATIDLQDVVIEYLLGTNPRLTEEEMQTQLIESATTHQQISEKELITLITMMKLKFNKAQLTNLKAGFDRIKIEEDTFWLTNIEAKRIATNREALVGKIEGDLISRKKEVTLEGVLKMAIDLDVASKWLGTPPRADTAYPVASPEMLDAARKANAEQTAAELPEPKTQREFINRLRQIKDSSAAKIYYDKWIDKLW